MEHDIFISYSRKDGNFVKFIEAELQRRGISYFIDKRNIKLSKDYADEIAKAIKVCRMMVFLWSENSNQSEHASNEITLAYNLRKPIVTLKVGRFEPAGGLIYRLSKYNYAEIETFRPEAVREMGNEISELLNEPAELPEKSRPEGMRDPAVSAGGNPQDRACAEGAALFSEREYAQAVERLAGPAIAGNPEAQETLCLIFRNYDWCAELVPDDYLQFRPEAEAGKPYAQFILARMYKTEFDDQAADLGLVFEWSLRAAEQGFRYAQFLAGLCYENGLGTVCDYRLAIDWYQRAAEQGDTYSMGNMALMHERGRGVPKGLKKAVEWYRKGEALGDETCTGNLGVLYLCGAGQPVLEHDLEKGVEYLLRAADLGGNWYLGYLGNAYEQGWGGLETDRDKAREYLELAAEAGEISAKYRIAVNYYAEGEGELAFAWCEKAARLNDRSAQYLMGFFFQSGTGCQADLLQAWEWYNRAAARGDANALYQLGELCETEQAPEGHDQRECVAWYTLAGEAGLLTAQQKLCEIYSEGILAEREDKLLLKWVKIAAENGDLDAQRRLGQFYLDGIGATSPRMKVLNETKGLAWYRKAAESGDLKAQLELARMYETGVVGIVCLNESKAHRWYLKAAENDSAEAQYKVGLKGYEEGEFATARPWLCRAVELGWPQAKQALHLIDGFRDTRKEMIDRAEELAATLGPDESDSRPADELFPAGIGYKQAEGERMEKSLRRLYAPMDKWSEERTLPKLIVELVEERNLLLRAMSALAERFNVAPPVCSDCLPGELLSPVYADKPYNRLKRETAGSWLFLKRFFADRLAGCSFYDDDKMVGLVETVRDDDFASALLSIVNICLNIESVQMEMYRLFVDMEEAELSTCDENFRSVADRLFEGSAKLMRSVLSAEPWYARISSPTDRDRERLACCLAVRQTAVANWPDNSLTAAAAKPDDEAFDALLNEFINN